MKKNKIPFSFTSSKDQIDLRCTSLFSDLDLDPDSSESLKALFECVKAIYAALYVLDNIICLFGKKSQVNVREQADKVVDDIVLTYQAKKFNS